MRWTVIYRTNHLNIESTVKLIFNAINVYNTMEFVTKTGNY